jgi:PST family polysaccharide transporter
MKSVFHNFLHLILIQVFGILTPIILTPFIIQKIGIEEYGVIATGQSLSVFFILLTDFGFNITTVRKLAQSQKDISRQTEIVQSVFSLKLILLTIATLLFLLLIHFIPHFKTHEGVYLTSLFLIAGQTFLPIWYYQGTDQLKKTSFPIFFTKLLTIIAMFVCIRSKIDSHWVNTIFGLGTLIGGIILYIPIFQKHRIKLRFKNIHALWNECKENLPVFFSNFCTVVYANSTLLIMGFMLDPKQLGLYSLADKLLQWIKSALVLIHNAVYPSLCKLVVEQPQQTIQFLTKTYRIVWPLVLSGALFFWWKTDWILSFFIDIQNQYPAYYQFLGFIIFMVSLNMPFFQTLLAWKKERPILGVVLLSSIISLTLNLLIVPIYGITGSLVILFCIETCITFSYFVLFKQFIKRLAPIETSTHPYEKV